MSEGPIPGSIKAIDAAISKGKDPNADLNAVDKSATKAQSALALKLYGASHTQIAEQLGYSSAARARAAIERLLASSADSAEDRDMMRELIGKRLDRLLQSTMGKAIDPREKDHLAYNARALAIVDRQAKLWGVDAPTQIQFTPTDQHIDAYIQKIRPLAEADVAGEEADIFDAEVIDDEED
jgi:hypothetical protein